jgi:predicted RNase H-like HicB family nuclease
MSARFVLTEYLNAAMGLANYDKLEDGTYGGRVPPCPGVVAFGATLRACEEELRSVLEDWVLVGLKLGHRLPVVAGLDLNREPARGPVDAV